MAASRSPIVLAPTCRRYGVRPVSGGGSGGGTTYPDGHRLPGSQQGDAIASFTINYPAKELIANGGHGFWGEEESSKEQ
jgi:hypothetical protein